jgi:hypothetical protein
VENENNGIPPELLEINSDPVNAHFVDTSTALLAGTLVHEEKQLKLISLTFSDFKHLT